MNSRQKRKLLWDETHEAPMKTHWVKTSEFGVISKHRDNNSMKGILSEMRTYGLIGKHSGSSKPSKLKAALNRYRPIWDGYKHMIEATNAMREDSEKIEDAEVISETIDINNEAN